MSDEQPIDRNEFRQLCNRIHSFIDEQGFFIRATHGHRWLDSLCLAFISKALSVSRGVISLVEADLEEEAFGFMRTLLEMALNLRYITNGRTPDVRAKRFIHFQSKIKMEWGRRGMKHFHWTPEEARDLRNYKNFVKWEKKFPRQSWYQTKKNGAWTGTLALEPDRYEKVPLVNEHGKIVFNKRGKPKMVPATWAFDYFWIYFWTSSFVHVNVDSLSNHAAVPGIPFKVYAKGCKRKGYLPADFGDQALFSTLVYLRAILIFAYRGLNSAPPENLLAALQEIVERSAGEEAVRRSRVQAGLI